MGSSVQDSDVDLEKATLRNSSPVPEEHLADLTSAEVPEGTENLDAEKAGGLTSEVDAKYTVDWDGDDDPQNPLNWSDSKKWSNMAVVSAITFITYVGSASSCIGLC
jgi:hypothetical protein